MERLQLLVADDDRAIRSLTASLAEEAVAGLAVLEAEDGAEALRVALQERPQLALLDVNMPRLDGIDVAVTARDLHVDLRVALYTADPFAHRERAREAGLTLFDKLELGRALSWVELQAEAVAEAESLLRTAGFDCAMCGYGVARRERPARCPMCGADAWAWSPLRRAAGAASI